MGRFVRVVGIDQYMLVRRGVRAASPSSAAAVSPLVSSPAAPPIASSHRTDARSSMPIRTPLGLTSRFSSPLSE